VRSCEAPRATWTARAVRALTYVVLIALAGCASLPKDLERPHSIAFADTGGTLLGRVLAPAIAANPGKSGAYPLPNGREAFAARVPSAVSTCSTTSGTPTRAEDC